MSPFFTCYFQGTPVSAKAQELCKFMVEVTSSSDWKKAQNKKAACSTPNQNHLTALPLERPLNTREREDR